MAKDEMERDGEMKQLPPDDPKRRAHEISQQKKAMEEATKKYKDDMEACATGKKKKCPSGMDPSNAAAKLDEKRTAQDMIDDAKKERDDADEALKKKETDLEEEKKALEKNKKDMTPEDAIKAQANLDNKEKKLNDEKADEKKKKEQFVNDEKKLKDQIAKADENLEKEAKQGALAADPKLANNEMKAREQESAMNNDPEAKKALDEQTKLDDDNKKAKQNIHDNRVKRQKHREEADDFNGKKDISKCGKGRLVKKYGLGHCVCQKGWEGDLCDQEDCKLKCKPEKISYKKLKKKTKQQKAKYNQKKLVWTQCKQECSAKNGGWADLAKESAKGNIASQLKGETSFKDYFQVKPTDNKARWVWGKRFGGSEVYGEMHASYAASWSNVVDAEGSSSVNTLYFAGGGARMKIWSFKMSILGAYVKLAGTFTPAECPDGDAGELTFQANLKMLVLSFGIDMEGTMCEPTPDPCKVQFITKGLDEHILGTMNIFTFQKTVFVGPIPLKFEVTADLEAYVQLGLEGQIGRPILQQTEKNFDGFEKDMHSTMGVLVGQVQPGLRAIVTAMVSINLGVAEAGGGIEIVALDLSVPVARGINVDSKKDALAVGLQVKSLSGRMWVFASIGPCPFCKEIEFEIINWKGLAKIFPLHPGDGMCAECGTTCVYGICDRATGKTCECALGYNGGACDVPCPGISQGNSVCNGRGVQECDELTGQNCVDDPELGCRWDEKKQVSSLRLFFIFVFPRRSTK